jgi:hypothetical protein
LPASRPIPAWWPCDAFSRYLVLTERRGAAAHSRADPEPAKWVARLRATAAPGGRLLFRPELGAGAHVGPAGRYDQLRYEAEILAFILDEAGLAPTAGENAAGTP